MAIDQNGPEDAAQGPAKRAPETEDGLYPDANGDLGHRQDGDTQPLPGSNEPLVSARPTGPRQTSSGPDPLRNDVADDPDLPVSTPPVKNNDA